MYTRASRSDERSKTSSCRSNFVGSPREVIEKILFQHEIFGHQRFMIQFSVGTLPHLQLMHSIELFGTQVAPAVRKALPDSVAAVAPNVTTGSDS